MVFVLVATVSVIIAGSAVIGVAFSLFGRWL
jgi:hypothetical protein